MDVVKCCPADDENLPLESGILGISPSKIVIYTIEIKQRYLYSKRFQLKVPDVA